MTILGEALSQALEVVIYPHYDRGALIRWLPVVRDVVYGQGTGATKMAGSQRKIQSHPQATEGPLSLHPVYSRKTYLTEPRFSRLHPLSVPSYVSLTVLRLVPYFLFSPSEEDGPPSSIQTSCNRWNVLFPKIHLLKPSSPI